MSEKKYDPSRRADESENVSPPSVMQTSLDAQNFKDQGSIDAGNEKEDCAQNLKAVSPESSIVISEEHASESDYDCDKSCSPKPEPDTMISSNTEHPPSTSGNDCTHERVPSDVTPMPTTSKGSLFLRKRLSKLCTIISESDCSSASPEDGRDVVRDNFLKYRGHLLPGEEASKPWFTKLYIQWILRGKSESSSASVCDLGNSSNSSADERDMEKEKCEKYVKHLGDRWSYSCFDSREESGDDWEYDNSEDENQGKKWLLDYYLTQRFSEAEDALNKSSESSLTTVQKLSVSDSKISNCVKYHGKEGNMFKILKLQRSFSAPPKLIVSRYSESYAPDKSVIHITKSLACPIEGETESKVHDIYTSLSKELRVLVGTSDKMQKDVFNERKTYCPRLDQPNIPAQTSQETSFALKSKLDIQDTDSSKNSENTSKTGEESIDNNTELNKVHLLEKNFENKPSMENLETLPSVNIVGNDSESKEIDKTEHDLEKSKEHCSVEETKPTFPHKTSESSPEIFKIPVVRRPKQLTKVKSPKQSSSPLDPSKTNEDVTPNNINERPKDLRGSVRSAYYEFSPSSPSGFVIRPYRSLPNVHMPTRKTNNHQNFTADQIKTAVRALFTGRPDLQTPSYRESPVIGEIKALLENMNCPDTEGRYPSKKSLNSRSSGSTTSKSDFTKFRSCRKLTFDSPKIEKTNINPTFQGHSSSDLLGEISNLELNDMVPSSSKESGGSAATLPITELLSEPSTSGVISPATQKKVSVFNPETGENADKVLKDDFNDEESQKNVLLQGRIVNVSVSPSKRKAETSEDDSSPTSIQASFFPGKSSESMPKRPVKKGKLSSELKFEKEDTIFEDIVTKQSLFDYMKPLSPEKKYEDNVKETVSPVKRKAEDSDTESAGCSFKESVQSESQKPTSKRTKLESETRVSDVTCDGDDNSENKDEKKKEN